MQCGSIIGVRSRLTSPCEGKDYKHSGDKLQSSIGMKSSSLPLTSPLRREGLYSLMKLAPMKCGSIIGARSR